MLSEFLSDKKAMYLHSCNGDFRFRMDGIHEPGGFLCEQGTVVTLIHEAEPIVNAEKGVNVWYSNFPPHAEDEKCPGVVGE